MPPRLAGTFIALAIMVVVTTAAPPAEKAVQHPQQPHQLPQHTEIKPAHQLEAPDNQVFFERCKNQQGRMDWIRYKNACYRWYEVEQYWEPAERGCNFDGGHLVSIFDAGENGFVGKLTYCQETWVGRYAVDADRMTHADNYRWTDRTNSQYHAHRNLSNAQLHFPLISTKNLQWEINVYHQKHTYVCKIPSENRNSTCNCPSGWKELNGYCYYMPPFTATYIEGDYYCRGRDAYLASVHTDAELRVMSLLDVDTHGCPAETWIGLVKLNPCRQDFATGNSVCYRWSDRSGDYNAKPKWMPGHPINDEKTNCVLLKDREIYTVPCYTRARFVCKKKAGQ